MAITCSHCQHTNLDTATACQECQAVIALVCIECGSFNPLPCQYCGECGVELPARPPASAAIPTDPAPPLPTAPLPEPTAPVAQDQPASDPTDLTSKKAMESPPPRPTPPPTPAADTPPPRPSVPRANPAPAASAPGTRLQLTQAVFVHLGSDERLELPPDQYLSYIGKPNEEIPPDIDVSHLPGAEIVSRIHAAIHNRDGVFTLEDAGSSNGTFLNGELIKPGTRFRRQLKAGDTISLGKGNKCSFRFELEE